MASTPERPGFLLLWIAAVVLSLSLAVAPLLPGPDTAGRPATDAGVPVDPAGATPGDPAVEPLPAVPEGLDGEETARAEPILLTGRVLDSDLRACPGATVRVRRPGQVQPLETTATDLHGRFRLPLALSDDAAARLLVSATLGDERSQELVWDPGTAGHRDLLLVLQPAGVTPVPPRAETRARERYAPLPVGLAPFSETATLPGVWFWVPGSLVPRAAGPGDGPGATRSSRRVDLLLRPLPGGQLLLLRLLAWLRQDLPPEEALEEVLSDLPEDLAGQIRNRLRSHRDQSGEGAHNGQGGGHGCEKARAGWKKHGRRVEVLLELKPEEAARLLGDARKGA